VCWDICSLTRMCQRYLVRAVYQVLLVDECRQWAGCVVGQAAFCSGMIGGHVLSWLPILPRHVREIPASVQLTVLHYWWRGRPALGSAIEQARQPILHKLCPVQVHERCVPLQVQLVNHTIRTKIANKTCNAVRSHDCVTQKLGLLPENCGCAWDVKAVSGAVRKICQKKVHKIALPHGTQRPRRGARHAGGSPHTRSVGLMYKR
jgi:hypothetical protein